jgi:hypothetical protein
MVMMMMMMMILLACGGTTYVDMLYASNIGVDWSSHTTVTYFLCFVVLVWVTKSYTTIHKNFSVFILFCTTGNQDTTSTAAVDHNPSHDKQIINTIIFSTNLMSYQMIL